jgi:hypothetical protein
MKTNKPKIKEFTEDENELSKFSNLTIYLDRNYELLNNNVIDYSSKY